MAEALLWNSTLRSLDLRENLINMRGAKSLSEALRLSSAHRFRHQNEASGPCFPKKGSLAHEKKELVPTIQAEFKEPSGELGLEAIARTYAVGCANSLLPSAFAHGAWLVRTVALRDEDSDRTGGWECGFETLRQW